LEDDEISGEALMKFSGETLMAYADGELDVQTCREIEAALPLQPGLAQQLADQRTLQSSLRASFAPVLHDAVPQRLIDAARGTSRQATAPRASATSAALRKLCVWQVPGILTLLAVLASGIAGRMLGSHPAPTLALVDGRMLASGTLATALSTQAGGAEPLQSAVLIGLSYLSKAGTYCRTFTVKQREAVAAVACREPDGWHIQALAHTGPKSPLAQYRMAGILVPPLILGAVDSTIDGSPLDSRAESAVRARDWRR
jgi:hypothetical protein